MTVLLALLGLLLALQVLCARRLRREKSRMMRPGREWDAEDVDRWLALIEPFPLHPPSKKR